VTGGGSWLMCAFIGISVMAASAISSRKYRNGGNIIRNGDGNGWYGGNVSSVMKTISVKVMKVANEIA
jgi:hypothetical protein